MHQTNTRAHYWNTSSAWFLNTASYINAHQSTIIIPKNINSATWENIFDGTSQQRNNTLASIRETRSPELTNTLPDDLSAANKAFMNNKFKQMPTNRPLGLSQNAGKRGRVAGSLTIYQLCSDVCRNKSIIILGLLQDNGRQWKYHDAVNYRCYWCTELCYLGFVNQFSSSANLIEGHLWNDWNCEKRKILATKNHDSLTAALIISSRPCNCVQFSDKWRFVFKSADYGH